MLGPLGDLLNLGENFAQWYNDVLVAVIKYMLVTTVPSTEEIRTGFFSVVLGGTLGLGNLVMVAVVVLVSVLVTLRIKKDHSLVISRTMSSMVGLVLFAYLFYRAYALLYNLQQLLIQLTINFLTGKQGSSAVDVNSAISGLDPLGIVVSALFGWIFGWLTYAETYGLRVMFFIVLMFYPLTIALRPLGGFFNLAFHLSNASMIVVLVAPPFMTAFLLLPMWIGNIIPGGDLIAGIGTFVGGLLAIATPIVIFALTMSFSNKVFGNLDAKVAGSVDISSMPAFNMQDINSSVHSSHMAPLQTPVAAPVSSAPKGSLLSDAKGAAVNASAAGITAAGHPHIAVVVKAADKAASRTAQKYKERGGGTR